MTQSQLATDGYKFSMAEGFSANRAVREYTERYYLPLASAYRTRAADRGRLGGELVPWRQAIASHWPEARFGTLGAEAHGAEQRVTLQVYLGGLDPEAVRVELYANAVSGGPPEHHPMERARKLDVAGDGYEYSATIPAVRPLGEYTPRLLPHHPLASVPLEAHEIRWQR